MVKPGDAFFDAETQHIILFAHYIRMNGMSFALNEHLGSGGPIEEQKAIFAVFASSSVVKARQHQHNKRWQQRSLQAKAFPGLLMVGMTKQRHKTGCKRKLFPNQLSGVPFE